MNTRNLCFGITPKLQRRPRAALEYFLIAGVFLLTGALSAQAVSSISSEKLPTTRDPSYIPPLVSEELKLGQESSAAMAVFGQSEGGLKSFLQGRREAELRKKRETGRFREREDQRMIEQGYRQSLLEERLLEQFDASGFPSNAGRYPYRESTSRRFSVIFLLALPVTASLSVGGIALYKSASQDSTGLSNTESILGAVFAIGSALGVAIYDYRRVARLRASIDRSQWPPPLKTRDGLIEEELEDLPPRTQGLLQNRKVFHPQPSHSQARRHSQGQGLFQGYLPLVSFQMHF